MRRVGVLMVVLLLWPAWSIGGALTAPGTDSTSARLAEWTRSNGLSWAVSGLEQAQYKMTPPKVGGSLAGGIPRIAPSRPAPNQPTRPASYLAPPATTPSQAQPPLPGEGSWQTLVNAHGEPAIRAAFLPLALELDAQTGPRDVASGTLTDASTPRAWRRPTGLARSQADPPTGNHCPCRESCLATSRGDSGGRMACMSKSHWPLHGERSVAAHYGLQTKLPQTGR